MDPLIIAHLQTYHLSNNSSCRQPITVLHPIKVRQTLQSPSLKIKLVRPQVLTGQGSNKKLYQSQAHKRVAAPQMAAISPRWIIKERGSDDC